MRCTAGRSSRRRDVARERAHRLRRIGQAQLAAAVGGAAQILQRRQVLAVLEARVVAQHPEANAAIGRRQGVHLRLHAAPALERAGAIDRVLQVLQVGLQLFGLVPNQLVLEHLVEHRADRREPRERRRREHRDEPRGDGQLHAAASSGRASST
jgi:hypothetical protein